MSIRFMKHFVDNGPRTITAKVYYSHSILINGKEAITLYSKDYDGNLRKVFPGRYANDSDMMTDYFEKDRVRIYKDAPLFDEALERCNNS